MNDYVLNIVYNYSVLFAVPLSYDSVLFVVPLSYDSVSATIDPTPAAIAPAPAIAPLVKTPCIPNEVKVANVLPILTAPIKL